LRDETLAAHAGCEVDPPTKAAAVTIYQTVAYAFDSVEHGQLCLISRSRVTVSSRHPTQYPPI